VVSEEDFMNFPAWAAIAASPVLFSTGVSAQSQTGMAATSTGTPLAAYRAFFHQMQFLEDEAQKATLTESTALRAWHQKQLGLTAQDATQLRQIAATHVAALKGLEEAASRIIEAQRSQFPGGRLASPNSLPPPPPGLAQLQKQRDDLTTAHVQGLQAALSAASFAKLDPWIKANFKQQGAKPGVPRPAPQGANQ
jgi:hypothetical protein